MLPRGVRPSRLWLTAELRCHQGSRFHDQSPATRHPSPRTDLGRNSGRSTAAEPLRDVSRRRCVTDLEDRLAAPHRVRERPQGGRFGSASRSGTHPRRPARGACGVGPRAGGGSPSRAAADGAAQSRSLRRRAGTAPRRTPRPRRSATTATRSSFGTAGRPRARRIDLPGLEPEGAIQCSSTGRAMRPGSAPRISTCASDRHTQMVDLARIHAAAGTHAILPRAMSDRRGDPNALAIPFGWTWRLPTPIFRSAMSLPLLGRIATAGHVEVIARTVRRSPTARVASDHLPAIETLRLRAVEGAGRTAPLSAPTPRGMLDTPRPPGAFRSAAPSRPLTSPGRNRRGTFSGAFKSEPMSCSWRTSAPRQPSMRRPY